MTLKSPERSPLFDLFIEPEAYGPIFDVLTSILPPADILAVRRTCKDAEHIFRHLQLSQWNVDVRLKRFFMDAKGFSPSARREQCVGFWELCVAIFWYVFSLFDDSLSATSRMKFVPP